MQILRKLLSANEVSSTKQRYNSTTDEIEYTPDDGTTWNSDPGSDPRRNDAYRLPARTGTDPRCDAAANIVEWTRAGLAEISTAVGAGSAIIFLVTMFLALIFTGPFALFILLITDLATLLYGLGQTAIDAALTTAFYDYLLCLLYCNLDADGQMSHDGYLAVQTGLDVWGGNAGDAVGRLYEISGEVGLSNSGTAGAETDDCTDCFCCEFVALVTQDYGTIANVEDNNWLATATFLEGFGYGVNIIPETSGETFTITAIEVVLLSGNPPTAFAYRDMDTMDVVAVDFLEDLVGHCTDFVGTSEEVGEDTYQLTLTACLC